MTVLTLHKAIPADDVVRMLRTVADDIEAGALDWPVTSAVVVLGHVTSERPRDDGDRWSELSWATFGGGPRSDALTLRGLMATAIHHWGHE